MPYKFESEKLKICRKDDKRVKLSLEQRDEIKYRFSLGESIHHLANEFKVCRRTIQFILFPERLKRSLELREERGGSKIYYDREKHNESVERMRRRKKELYDEGRLVK